MGDNGKVYAFEPDKTNYNYLMKMQAFKNVVFYNKAVSDKTEKITLYHSDLLNVTTKRMQQKTIQYHRNRWRYHR